MRGALGTRAPKHIDNPPFSRPLEAYGSRSMSACKACHYSKAPTAETAASFKLSSAEQVEIRGLEVIDVIWQQLPCSLDLI